MIGKVTWHILLQNTTIQIKGTSYAAQAPVQVRAPSPVNSGFQNIYAGGQVTSTGIRNHLSAAPFNSIVHRHGSMPNVRKISFLNHKINEALLYDLHGIIRRKCAQ